MRAPLSRTFSPFSSTLLGDLAVTLLYNSLRILQNVAMNQQAHRSSFRCSLYPGH